MTPTRVLQAVALLGGLACGAATFSGCMQSSEEATTTRSSSQALAGDGLVISQVYGGSVYTYANYKRNFIELFNRSSAPVSLGGLSVQVQGEAGNFNAGTSNVVVLPNVTVPPGGYFLIGCDPRTDGDLELPAVDLDAPSTITLDLAASKVALARGTSPLACGASGNRCSATSVVDLVGYAFFESATSDWEGTGRAAGEVRRGGGCTDTNDNVYDFVDSNATPRNSSSPRRSCSQKYGEGLVIGQVYGGGWSSESTFERHFVEIFNRSASPVSLAGLSLQHTSWPVRGLAGGFVPSAEIGVLPEISLPPGGRYLVSYLAQPDWGLSGPRYHADLDVTVYNYWDPYATFALARVTSMLGCGGISCATDEIIDLVSFDVATLEGHPLPRFSTKVAMFRKGNGCTDTNNNAADFDPGAPVPRGSLAYPEPCTGTSTFDAGVEPVEGGTGLVIGQVFAGGGRSDASLDRDYIEIFNRTPEPLSLAGMSLQYGEGNSDFGSNPAKDIVSLPDVIVPGEQYLLIGMRSDDSALGAIVPAEISGWLKLDPANGKIALARTRAPLGCGGASRCPSTLILDMVGYGTSTDFEGAAAAPAPGNGLGPALLRSGAGCVDTGDNAADFTLGAPVLRTRTTPAVDCALPAFARDAGASDSGTSDAGDAGALDDASVAVDAAPSDTGAPPAQDDGCSCRTAGARRVSDGGLLASMMLAGAAIASRVKRRRASARPRA